MPKHHTQASYSSTTPKHHTQASHPSAMPKHHTQASYSSTTPKHPTQAASRFAVHSTSSQTRPATKNATTIAISTGIICLPSLLEDLFYIPLPLTAPRHAPNQHTPQRTPKHHNTPSPTRHSCAGRNPQNQAHSATPRPDAVPLCPFRPRRKGRERSERGMPGAGQSKRTPNPLNVRHYPTASCLTISTCGAASKGHLPTTPRHQDTVHPNAQRC